MGNSRKMKDALTMALFSRRKLTPLVAREQIAALSSFGGGLMRPDKCSEAEPIRSAFDPADLSGPIEWLLKPNGTFLYRKGSPIQMSGEIWNLSRSLTARVPAGPFVNYSTGRFDSRWVAQIGIATVRDFVVDMFHATGSDFGFLTDISDLQSKNTSAVSYSYKGMNPETGLPGLYWMNLFSDELANWLCLTDFPQELAILRRLPRGGFSLQFCESPEQCSSASVLQKQRAAIEWLGPEKFFDVRSPNRKAETPDWIVFPLPSQGPEA